jgi:uncharacterized protein YndB with AHSA1/START domain
MSREVRAEAQLAASPDEVWEIVMDPGLLGEWVTTHEGLEGDVPNRLKQGSVFRQRLKIGGPTFTVIWNVVECDPPHRVRWEGEGPGGSKADVEYELESHAKTTRFTYANRFELPGGALGRLAGRTIGERVAKREADRTLENLARLIATVIGGRTAHAGTR